MWLQTGEERQWLAIERGRIEDMARKHHETGPRATGASARSDAGAMTVLARLGVTIARTLRTRVRPATR